MTMSIRSVIAIFLIFSFAGGALLSFVMYHKNDMHHSECPITNAQGGVCPATMGGIASAVFYMRAFSIFFAVIFFALSTTLLYERFFSFSKIKKLNFALLFFAFSFLLPLSKITSKISTMEFVSWFALHEQSPCLA